MWRKTAVVLPARAGMSPNQRAISRGSTSAPRASGDEPTWSMDYSMDWKCSPRERG